MCSLPLTPLGPMSGQKNNAYCQAKGGDVTEGLKDAALALARQGKSLLFKAPGNHHKQPEWGSWVEWRPSRVCEDDTHLRPICPRLLRA